MTAEAPPVVIGAGPSGLAAAWALQRAGCRPVVLDRGHRVCESWRHHYRSLHLNSPRRWSSLPGLAMDRSLGAWVARDDFVEYVERYARMVDPDIRFGVEVQRLDPSDGGWRLETSAGPMWAPSVVVAAGLKQRPFLPDWPGRDSFAGELVHVTDYDDAAPYAGRDVLVVGLGASASDVAVELARSDARRVRVAVRTPAIMFRRHISTALMTLVMKFVPLPVAVVDRVSLMVHRRLWRDLSGIGLAEPVEGLATSLARRGHGATMDRGLVSAARQGRVEIVPAVERFEGPDVVLADDRRIRPDAVIAATGQRPVLEGLVGHLRGVLDERGRPVVHGGRTAPSAPGLYFVGFRLPAGQLMDLHIDVRVVARRVRARASIGAGRSSAPPLGDSQTSDARRATVAGGVA